MADAGTVVDNSLEETTVIDTVTTAKDGSTAPANPPASDAPATDALVLRGLRKTFTSGLFGRGRSHVAVDGLDLRVPAGSIHALLGPNGAGKTTTVSMVATLSRPDAGQILVDGIDAVAEPTKVRDRIGVSGQYAAVDGTLTGFENLRMVGQLYGMSRREASTRAREMIAELDLTEAADRPMRTYSGGMRRRLDLAGAVINRPRLVILDEPTTGLDPRGRRQIWEVITGLVATGTTILLTTQYLEEADELADEITVIDAGSVRARGTAAELKRRFGSAELTVEVDPHGGPDNSSAGIAPTVLSVLSDIGTAAPVRLDDTRFAVAVDGGSRTAVATVTELTAHGISVVDASVSAPTLDSVFLHLTERPEEPSADVH